MPGGGVWNVMPGQVTDDSELAMCLLRGLVAGRGKLDLFQHALYYGHWIASEPFDIGGTIKNGLSKLALSLDNPDPCLAQSRALNGKGAKSMSNGSLMRITPLAVWARNLNVENLHKCVVAEISMTHSMQAIHFACTAYCIAIKVLTKNADDDNRAAMAVQAVRDYAAGSPSMTLKKWMQSVD